MNARSQLREGLLSAVARLETGGKDMPPPLGLARGYTFDSPVFGKCRLIPHAVETPPPGEVALCYVAFDGSDELTASVWTGGRFNTRGLKPFKKPVVRWYHIERMADGSTL